MRVKRCFLLLSVGRLRSRVEEGAEVEEDPEVMEEDAEVVVEDAQVVEEEVVEEEVV